MPHRYRPYLRFAVLDTPLLNVTVGEFPVLDPIRQQSGRCDEVDPSTQRNQELDVRTSDPAVQYVAYDGDGAPIQGAQTLTQRSGIQQCLCRVLVGTVTGVDHMCGHPACQPMRPARRWMANHH